MDAGQIAALITAIIGFVGIIGTYRTSARKSDLEALQRTIDTQKEAIDTQKEAIDTLQAELRREREAREQDQIDHEAEIKRLKDRIAELEGVDKRRRRGMDQRDDRERGLG